MKPTSDLESGKQNHDELYLKDSKHEQDISYHRRNGSVQILSTLTWSHLPESVCIIIWISLSCSITLFNKWLMAGKFAYPCSLTTIQLAFTTIMTRIFFAENAIGFKTLRETVLNKQILVMALLFSIALTFGNSANLYLSVPSMQMLKSLNPVVLLAALWTLGLQTPDKRTLASSALIVIGAVSAYYGTINMNQIGLLLMGVAILTHNARMVMTQQMIKSMVETEKPAIMTLCYFAPLGAIMIGISALILELPTMSIMDFRNVGSLQLTVNAALAFLLNMSSFDLIGRTSPYTLSVCAVVRDVILIIVSSFIWQQPMTTCQIFGYAVVLSGIVFGAWRKK